MASTTASTASNPPTATTTTAAPAAPVRNYPWHGIMFQNAPLPPPTCVLSTTELARPNYTEIDASEYLDSPAVIETKAQALVALLKKSNCTLVYAGAGLSTSSGIPDYASRAVSDKSVVQPKSKINFRKAEPTLGHRAIATLERRGLIDHFLQQNHDGLAQKAGFPFDKLNEIHGSWWDRTNPVVAMTGTLRSDLYKWMERWLPRPELVLALGTSFSGLSADRVAEACAKRFAAGQGLGLVVVAIQRTPFDGVASIRFFAKIDDVMAAVVKQMGLTLETTNYPQARPQFWKVPKNDEPCPREAAAAAAGVAAAPRQHKPKRSASVAAATKSLR